MICNFYDFIQLSGLPEILCLQVLTYNLTLQGNFPTNVLIQATVIMFAFKCFVLISFRCSGCIQLLEYCND